MKRRDFFRLTGSGLAANSFLPGFRPDKIPQWFDWFKLDTDRVLVLIQLDGGNDGLNTVIPLDQMDLYNKARQSVALPANKVLSLPTTIKSGLHPALDEIRGLYTEGRIKIIQSVGYPSPNYSHFRSTDIWMSASDAEEVLSSGWAGRYLNHEYPNYPNGFPTEDMPDPLSVEIGYGQSLAFQGPATSMSVTIANPEDFNKLIQGIETPLPQTPFGDKLGYVRLIKKQSNTYGERMKDAFGKTKNKASYPEDNDLADQLKIVARLIAGGLKTRIYKVSISGFDTHDNQVQNGDHATGEHANLLRRISGAVKAFLDDLTALGLQDRVVGMTVSEFGRRIISNASRGTDHGAAAPMFLFGNAIQGGLLGENPTLPAEAKWDDNIPMQYDFRSVYGSLLENWFCINKTEVQQVLLKNYQTLPVIKPAYSCLSTPTREENQLKGISIIHAFPNPFTSIINFKVQSNGEHSSISIFNPAGQVIHNIHHGLLSKGEHQYYWNSEDLPVGNYYVRFQSGPEQQVKLIVKVR
ncbi:MAG TPA: DUF1501 domain-containing protein [Saprospiraceae bacterium]|nr:DUF1501 domain-containing protein [Saprospiraceae bacterium]HNT19380.1 DUF1501 domain-containing protein [Saprospiraceae bacterium]